MATMNFSVPEDVKETFDREFAGRNKNAVITELIREAVAEVAYRREDAIRLLTERRKLRPTVNDDEIRRAREEGRKCAFVVQTIPGNGNCLGSRQLQHL